LGNQSITRLSLCAHTCTSKNCETAHYATS